jgi:hypothetical protein
MKVKYGLVGILRLRAKDFLIWRELIVLYICVLNLKMQQYRNIIEIMVGRDGRNAKRSGGSLFCIV